MRASLTLLSLLGTFVLNAQQVQWLTTEAIAYDINPEMPVHLVCASTVDQVYTSH